MKRGNKVRPRITSSVDAERRSLKSQHKSRTNTHGPPYRWMWHAKTIRVFNRHTGRTVRRFNIASSGGFAAARELAMKWLALLNESHFKN